MRQLKHAQSRNRKENSQPSRDGLKGVSCEMRKGGSHVDERQNTKAGKGYEQERSFPETSGVSYNLFAAGTACIFVAYEVPTDRKHNKHDL